LDPVQCTPENVRNAVLAALTDSTFRSNAERIQREISTLPGQDYAVNLLERLAAEKRPLYVG
jgi:UDP:flavonoid glycosyltransferase YjiC (YdhE family)